ncbi:unnamed protein product, partial [Mesorhabditis belari]|uniref:Zinc finger PHD-type domain-containing protein n=1 Tax=Mesorhabditis belari TaxID=2138241 RepID=A0AAF3FI03_9BILA
MNQRRVLSDFANTMNKEKGLTTPGSVAVGKAKEIDDESLEETRANHSAEFLKMLAEIVHHSDADLDHLVEKACTQMEKNVYEKDYVKLDKADNSRQIVVATKRRGPERFIKVANAQEDEFINQNSVIKLTVRGTKDFRKLIETIAKKNGKYWIVSDKLCREFGIKNKIHPLMLKKSVDTASGKDQADTKRATPRASTDIIMLSDSPTKKKTISKASDESRKKLKEQAASTSTSAAKAKAETKKRQPTKKQKKVEEKEEKNQDKTKKSVKLANDIKKKEKRKSFFNNSAAASIKTGSPFLNPQKRAEKKFEALLGKLRKEFTKGTKDTFIALVNRSAKEITPEQARAIDESLIKYFVMRAHRTSTRKEALSKVSPSKKAAQKAELQANLEKGERHEYMMNLQLLKAHFIEISQREDLSVCIMRLELDNMVSEEESFSNVLALSQAYYSLKRFLDHEHYLGAEFLYTSMKDGFTGFSVGLGLILQSFFAILQQSKSLKMQHFGQRLEHYTIDILSLSEICRSTLIGEIEKQKDGAEDAQLDADDAKDCDSVDKSVVEDLLTRFTSDVEFWSLSLDDQLAIVLLIMDKVLDTDTYNDYIYASASEELKEKSEKEKNKLSRLKEELAAIPIEEEPDYANMERSQTRALERNKKRREELDEKITRCEDNVNDLKAEIQAEQDYRKFAMRNMYFGMDRHFRRYYFFGEQSPNHAVWVHDLGTTAEEVIFKKLALVANDPEHNEEDEDKLKVDPKERWFCLRKAEDITELSVRLNTVGSREKSLKEELGKMEPLINAQKKYEQHRRQIQEKKSGSPINPASSSLEALKDSLTTFANEIFTNRLSSLKESEVFNTRIKTVETMKCTKELLRELVESIQPSAISPVLAGVFASTTFTLPKWIGFLEGANTCSGLSMLLDVVHSRINWESSVNSKRCKKCGRKNNIDEKLLCRKCGTCYHIYCVRPRPENVSLDWLCFGCIPVQPAESENFNLDGLLGRHNRKNSEEFEDCFSTKDLRPIRKRAYIDESDAASSEDEYEPRGPSARTRRKDVKPVSAQQKFIVELYEQIKAKRIYTSLSNLNIPRPSRSHRDEVLSVNGIEKKIDEGSFRYLDEFKQNFKKLLDVARDQLAGRKLEQIDDLEVLLNEVTY